MEIEILGIVQSHKNVIQRENEKTVRYQRFVVPDGFLHTRRGTKETVPRWTNL